ncbi:MAG: hypothetical protein COB24_01390 [Hyphomicrobiales bacterium]|nr:MAG: hypothetical protein COB24_01390 [Hyphomicrobiales bacterium]
MPFNFASNSTFWLNLSHLSSQNKRYFPMVLIIYQINLIKCAFFGFFAYKGLWLWGGLFMMPSNVSDLDL